MKANTHNTNLNFLSEKMAVIMPVTEMFETWRSGYLSHKRLFLALFNCIPNVLEVENIDCEKARNWFISKHKSLIKDEYLWNVYSGKKHSEFCEAYYLLLDDLIVFFNFSDSTVEFLYRKTDDTIIKEMIDEMYQMSEKKESKILLLIETGKGFGLKSLEINSPKLSMEENYNDDFRIINETILARLNIPSDKGLVLLHGIPGAGKTYYIRYLISKTWKRVIFLPPHMANSITSPELITIFINNPNSILVIEDAENIILDRGIGKNSSVSTLLNITDGLLSDCLNIQIICSFNTEISKIDKALLRKGRLIAKYEFKELEPEKATMLSRKLGFDKIFDTPVSLTAVYNQKERDFQQAKKHNTIGFKA